MESIIIGNGTVGTALGKAMKKEPLGPGDEKVKSDVVIICVPTETVNGQQDLSNVKQALGRVENTQLVIIRSTVLPGTTEDLQKTTELPLMFVPEFGFERTMVKDLEHPDFYILGETNKSQGLFSIASKVLPEAKNYELVSATSAEFAKYFCNMWGANQVALANTFYDWVMQETGNSGIYTEAIKAAMRFPNLPKWGWDVMHQNERGYSGKCLPKDMKAAISKFPHPIWTNIDNYNETLRNTL